MAENEFDWFGWIAIMLVILFWVVVDTQIKKLRREQKKLRRQVNDLQEDSDDA